MRRRAACPNARSAAPALFALAMGGLTSIAAGHSASDAYLTMTAAALPGRGVIHGQWDIALRDLDFVLKLDDNGDGRVTWGETKHHLAAIEHYAYAHLRIDDDAGNPCAIKPGAPKIDGHADGAYAALFFDVVCAHAPKSITVHYDLFFAIDPSHRGIFVMHNADDVATSVLSPQNATIDLAL
jgi:hypothetical protein